MQIHLISLVFERTDGDKVLWASRKCFRVALKLVHTFKGYFRLFEIRLYEVLKPSQMVETNRSANRTNMQSEHYITVDGGSSKLDIFFWWLTSVSVCYQVYGELN